MKKLELRKTQHSDLDRLFDLQADDEAGYMAAFVSSTWKDRDAYFAKWEGFLADPDVNSWTILVDGTITGSIGTYVMDGETQIGYGIGREYWGLGYASRALALFLKQVETKPLHGRAASDNIRSIKMLEKAGFKKTGTDRGFALARNKEIDEVLFRLDN
jgi:ribosomal-protein-alanine N-acetyltransferase